MPRNRLRAGLAFFGVLSAAFLLGCPATTTPQPGEGEGEGEGEDVALELVASGFSSPVAVAFPEDDSGRAFIVDRIGVVTVLTEDGDLLESPMLDVRDALVPLMESFDERGLLGLALHPRFAENGRLFIYYSVPLRPGAPADFDHTSRISELLIDVADPDRVDPASERVLLEVDQPQFNHNAGALAFGPDGFLYISLGDGGGANDVGVGHPPLGNGQDPTTLLGSILRLDVDGAEPYAIPEDNPFADGALGRPEIFAWGLRNPYRMSFDLGGERKLFVGDAGQDQWEEVSIVERGQNLGWNIREGTHCFDPDNPTVSPTSCATQGPSGEPLVEPLIEYRNSKTGDGIGLVVVGGYVYRGDDLPGLEGSYVFGDWSRSFEAPEGTLLVARPPSDGEGLWQVRSLLPADGTGTLPELILGFAQDPDGELYVLTSRTIGPTGDTGSVWRLAPSGAL